MDKRTKDILVAGVAIGVAAVCLYFAFAGRSPKVNLGPYEVLGVVTAEEIAKLLTNRGSVLVMARDTGPDKNPSVEAELKAFTQTIQKQPGLRMITDRIEVTPMAMMATGGGVPPDELFKALQAHAPVGALVLFFGFPPLSDAQLDALDKYGAKTVVVSAFHPDYRKLLERGSIHLAIVPRPEPAATAGQPARTVRERFDEEFMVVRAAEAAPLQ